MPGCYTQTMAKKRKTAAQLDREIAEALAEAQLKKKAMTAEYHVLKRALADPNPTLSEADLQELRSKFAALDAELEALNTAEWIKIIEHETLHPKKGGF